MAVPNKEPLPKIFELTFDEMEPIFDWLSLNDLIAVGKTCKRMQKEVGTHLQYTYPSTKVVCGTDGLYIHKMNVDYFSAYVQKMAIWCGNPAQYDVIASHKFESLKQIDLFYTSLNEASIMSIKSILDEVEVVNLHHCNTEDEFSNAFLERCTKMNRLYIEINLRTNTIIGANNNWLLKKYPKLEYFGLETSKQTHQIEELNIFLEQNPSIKSFTINSDLLCAHKQALLEANIKLDILTIKVQSSTQSQNILNILNELQMHNFCQQLFLFFEHFVIDEQMINQMAPLTSLTELHLNDASGILDKNLLAQTLMNMERLKIHFTFSDDILPFIRYTVKLSMLTIDWLGRGKQNENGVLDLFALNKEREKLYRARKVTVYVNEFNYLETKHANMQVDLNLIQLKRKDSNNF